MNLHTKKVLYVDLSKKDFIVKQETGLIKYVGGVGIGLKLLADNLEKDPVIFAVGPLNGMIPYCSKTAVIIDDSGTVEDFYLGGSLSSRIKFTGLDAIVLVGTSKVPTTLDITDETVVFREEGTDVGTLGLPGKRSILYYDQEKAKFLLDKYFTTPDLLLEKKLLDKNVQNIVVTGTKTIEIKYPDKYEDIVKKLLSQTELMHVRMSNRPSCVGCPMGCKPSKIGEIGGNVISHSLVACTYAENIFSDIGVVFSCLNILGYDYTHEDIENLPYLIEQTSKELGQ